MWRTWLARVRRSLAGDRFRPILSLDDIAACGRLPIVCVLAFATDNDRTSDGRLGPGVGGILASLLRRDLQFTRQLSIIPGEDTGYLQPNGSGAESNQFFLDDSRPAVIVVGYVRTEGDSLVISLRVLKRHGPPGGAPPIQLRGTTDLLSSLMPTVASAVCEDLGVEVEGAVANRWRQHGLADWETLLMAARCWETEEWEALAQLFRAGNLHPDATAIMDVDGPERAAARSARARANRIEPDNPQLAFNEFCVRATDRNAYNASRMESILRVGLASAPGHGKLHMVLPHVLAPLPGNIPFILAHSEVGYRLLRTNSFAVSNFCSYLMWLSPEDERIFPLISEGIRCDPNNPSSYEDAICFYVRQEEPEKALVFARALYRLCIPPLNERTWYCLMQRPNLAQQNERGQFDPQQYAASYVSQCEALMKRV